MGACIRDKIKEKVYNVLREYDDDCDLIHAEASLAAENICEALDITEQQALDEDAKIVVQMPEGE
jgi:hypothetical protein